MSFKQFIIFLLVLLVFLPLAWAFSWPRQKLKLVACEVGQGDAILFTKGTTQVLLDGGPGGKVLDCLKQNMPFWDRTLELVVNSHPEKDHLGGLLEVFKRYQVKQFVWDGVSLNTQTYQEFMQLIKEKNIPHYISRQGDVIKLAGLEFLVLWPPSLEGKVLGEKTVKEGETNDLSLVLELQYGQFKALFTGDIDEQVEKQIIKDKQFDNIEVLKIAHHGSKYSSNQEFLEAVRPKIAIISVGKNSYGHPTQEVLNRLKSLNINILRTDQDNIIISY